MLHFNKASFLNRSGAFSISDGKEVMKTMSVFRIEKNKNYTVMANYHLRDERLSLKARGLLSMILSLPEDWDYSLAGLVSISKDGLTAVSYLHILAPELSDKMLADFLDMDNSIIVNLHVQSIDQAKPFKRLWISSMEDSAIREGFDNLRPGSDFDDLYDAAVARSEADWLVGINATRLFSTLYGRKLTVGRVQTPTLAMLVDRSEAIKNFVKQKYFNVHLSSDGFEAVKEKIFDEAEADRIVDKCNGQTAVITSVTNNRKTINPPKLYDLTTLQREANRFLGMTAQQTLNATQSLYEQKLVTYPRTDSRFLTEDMEDTAASMVDLVRKLFPFGKASTGEPDIRRVLNSKKVTDHHAIIPTVEIGKADISALPREEQDILKLISKQLLMATNKAHIYMDTEVIATCAGEDFKAKGKTIIENGWKSIERAYRSYIGNTDKSDDEDQKELPEVTNGQILTNVSTEKSEHYTSPPKPYTEDSLLSSMETAGNEDFDEDTEKKGIVHLV